MGQQQSSNMCCLQDKKQSLLEISMQGSMENSFYRNSSYESPIPDEVHIYEEVNSVHSENFIDDWSTDIDKQQDISEGDLQKLPNSNFVKLGTVKLKVFNISLPEI